MFECVHNTYDSEFILIHSDHGYNHRAMGGVGELIRPEIIRYQKQ
jgi:hypothetical protein